MYLLDPGIDSQLLPAFYCRHQETSYILQDNRIRYRNMHHEPSGDK